jgi:hypothetical protein
MSVLISKKSSWLGYVALFLLLVLGCDQHGTLISPEPAITIQQGAITQGGESPHTSLHQAVLKGELKVVRALLKNIDVNTPDNEGNTALHLAVLQGNLDLVKFLVAAKANVHAKNIAGITPLQLAVQKGNPQIIKELGAVGSSIVIQEGGKGEKGMSLAYLLFHWDYENIGKKRILDHVPMKDRGHLRATCVEMNWMLLHKEAFQLSLSSDRLGDMRLQDYPRLYPHVKNDAHCVCLTFQPIPTDAMVRHLDDWEKVTQGGRLAIKNVAFKGKRIHLETLLEALPGHLKESLLLPEDLSEEEPDLESSDGPIPDEEEGYSGGENEEKPEITNTIEESSKDLKTEPEEIKSSNNEEATTQKEATVVDENNSLYNSFIGVNKLPSGKITIDKYLAEGAFGEVYKGSWGDKKVALKKINVMKAAQKLGLYTEDVKDRYNGKCPA